MIAFAVVGVFGLWFLAGETRRFHKEHDESQRRHHEVMDAAEEALKRSRTPDDKAN